MTLKRLQNRPRQEEVSIEMGDYVVLIVPPFIKGLVSDICDGKYEREVILRDSRWGTVVVGAKHVRKLVQGKGSEDIEKVA